MAQCRGTAGANDWAEVIKRALLCLLVDLLRALLGHMRLSEGTGENLLVEVAQVVLVNDGRDEGGGDFLVE